MKINVKVAKLLLLAFLCELSTLAFAQTFNGFQIFGDSNTDDGRYAVVPKEIGVSSTIHTPGSFTTPGGRMWSDALGAKYGLNISTSASGGSNYAAGGATVLYTAPGTNTWSVTDQVNSYLNSVGGKANPNNLYTVYIGINDLNPVIPAFAATGDPVNGHGDIVTPGAQNLGIITSLANQTARLVVNLHNAGAKYIVVPNVLVAPENATAFAAANFGVLGANGAATSNGTPFPTTWGTFYQTWADSVHFYNQSVWTGISAQGVNFIPADLSSVFNYVILN
jgi:outer membrane lipase/esterase